MNIRNFLKNNGLTRSDIIQNNEITINGYYIAVEWHQQRYSRDLLDIEIFEIAKMKRLHGATLRLNPKEEAQRAAAVDMRSE